MSILPVATSASFLAHFQKGMHDLLRGRGRVSGPGLLIQTMENNSELAADILAATSDLEDETLRTYVLLMLCAAYQTLKSQAESERMEA